MGGETCKLEMKYSIRVNDGSAITNQYAELPKKRNSHRAIVVRAHAENVRYSVLVALKRTGRKVPGLVMTSCMNEWPLPMCPRIEFSTSERK